MTQLKVGVVGCGHISATHFKAWRKTENCKVTGLFDVNQTLAEKRAKEFQINRIHGDVNSLISESDIVDVCTPPQTHSEIAQTVVVAGKHLVIEKPLVTDIEDWEQILNRLSGSPSKITVVHNLKYTHAVQTAKRYIDQGRIGEVIAISRQFLTNPETDRMLVGNTHWSHRLPGGRWFETLPHELYLIHYFAGDLELSGVTTVHTSKAPPGAPADEVLINLRNDRCVATIHYSANCRLNRRMMMIYGTQGVITIGTLSGSLLLSRVMDRPWTRVVGAQFLEAGRALLRAIPDRSSYLLRSMRGQTPHALLIQAVSNHMNGSGPAPTPLEEIDYVVRNCDFIGKEIDRQLAENLPA